MSTFKAETGGKIIAVHLNYPSRAQQRGRTPATPSYFLKPLSSVALTGSSIERPAGTELLAFEGEIALIMGTAARWVSAEDGWEHVASITAANDFGLYDLRAADKGSNLRNKGGDGFTPIGVKLISARSVDPSALRLRTWVNGKLVQDDTTETLLFPFGQLVADLSQHMTLEPGDIILTGTPAGSSVVVPGDVVEVQVDAPSAPGAPSSGKLATTVTQGTTEFSDVGAKPAVDDKQREEAWGSAEAAGLTESAPAGLPPKLRAKLEQVGTATLSARLRARGYVDIFIEGAMPSSAGSHMVGPARTLRFVPFRPDLFAEHGGGFNAQKRLFDTVEPDEVIVIDARRERGTGTVGDVLALRAQARGAAGIVTDGGIRDFEQVAGFDIPTFSQGGHPSVLGRRHVPWETDVAISCGGAAVVPGDIIVGDGDGVIVIPAALVEEIADEAIAQEREDTFVAEQVANGESVDGLFPMNAEWRARFDKTNGKK